MRKSFCVAMNEKDFAWKLLECGFNPRWQTVRYPGQLQRIGETAIA
jgi:hypothetical protein